jgi:hypothetical protein
MKYRQEGPMVADATMDRFWSYVCKDVAGCDCWNWTSYGDNHGNPSFRIDGRRYAARKLLYHMVIADVPPAHFVVVSCRNRLCMNPAHFAIVPSVLIGGWYADDNGA